MAITIQIDGMEKAVKKLQELKDIDRKEYRKIKTKIKRAAVPMRDAIRGSIKDGRPRKDISRYIKKGKDKRTGLSKFIDVKYRPGNLKRSIDIIMSTRNRSLVVNVGARFGRKAKANADGFYAALVQYGTQRGGARGLAKARGDKRYSKYNTSDVQNRSNVGYVERGFDTGVGATISALEKQMKYILETAITRISANEMR